MVKGSSTLSTIGSTAYTLAMIAAVLLVVFGIRLARRAEERRRGVLMIVAAAVLVGNVLILTL